MDKRFPKFIVTVTTRESRHEYFVPLDAFKYSLVVGQGRIVEVKKGIGLPSWPVRDSYNGRFVQVSMGEGFPLTPISQDPDCMCQTAYSCDRLVIALDKGRMGLLYRLEDGRKGRRAWHFDKHSLTWSGDDVEEVFAKAVVHI